jgi:hypothetical protein
MSLIFINLTNMISLGLQNPVYKMISLGDKLIATFKINLMKQNL